MQKKGTYRQYALERVIHGVPFDDAALTELKEEGVKRALLLGSRDLAGSEAHCALKEKLGSRLAAEYLEIPPHSPLPSILEAVKCALKANVDHIIAFGGGSVIDAAKAVSYWLGKGLEAAQDLKSLPPIGSMDPSRSSRDEPGWVRITAIPVTLSAAEFTYFAGVTEPVERVKLIFAHRQMAPRAVIYDPLLTVGVDLPIFLASGIKALDHAVERLASRDSHPMSDATGLQAVKMLSQALVRVHRDPGDLNSRMECQLAAWLSISGGNAGVRVGASHAIGHVLGAHANVPHGITSCVLLPSVMRWNISVNEDKQRAISDAMGRSGSSAGDAIGDLIEVLGLPSRLRDVGVREEDLDEISEKCMHDPMMAHNPREVRSGRDALEILRMAW